MSPGEAAAVVETHSAVVFFVGDQAYKLKKPVDLGFLDFRRREAREAVCRREVELNRRLAPDVYLGVSDVLGVDGTPCDHLVVMKRMPVGRRLALLASDGADLTAEIEAVAHLFARFHREADRSPAIDAMARADEVLRRWEDSVLACRRFVGSVLDGDVLYDIARLAARYLRGRQLLFDRRVAEGRSCDGHGDLLADDVFCLPDGPRVLDCLEFDDRLRWGDALADVAFLAMDLERLGRGDLSVRLLDTYAAVSGDTWPPSLAHHHIAYRALVRAKVACIRVEQGAGAAAQGAHALLRLAHAHLAAGRVRLVLVGGLPGAGKSTLAAGLAPRLDAVVLRSDVVRKELAGLSPASSRGDDGFGRGIHGAESTAATYSTLLDRARVLLGAGRSVVLDASFGDSTWRTRARVVGTQAYADVYELECAVPDEVAAARITRRRAAGVDPSDATVDVARAMAASADPWPEAVRIDSDRSPEEVVDMATAALAEQDGAPCCEA